MKKILSGGFIAAMAIFAISCNSNFKKTDNGLLYKFYEQNKDARQAQINDIIEGYVVLMVDSNIQYQSAQSEKLFQVAEQSMFEGDINEGLALLHEGDSVVFKVSIDYIVNYKGGVNTTGQEYAIYSIKVTRILSESELASEMAVEAEKMKPVEEALISNYLKENKLNVKPTESGLYFIPVRKGSGAKLEQGQTVKINYIGRMLDGRIFDGNWESELKKAGVNTEGGRFSPMQITLGVGQVIPGFEEAIMLMQTGGRAKVIIPSSLAYGGQGNQGIPPYSPIVFDLEVVK
ncbi:MAG: FKBP-type peptidyl-prolyl cis-trans isomerase [Bacteroidales bacterium]|jgi:FKBP-type peptidyl-prolyl cis-trans isomerase|nr:FKBP-type peptidyl-prolyl cis-trans isomerase [Bacteroidales bacterium]